MEGASCKQRAAIIDRAADRGAAAKELTRRSFDRGSEGGGGLLIADSAPGDHLDVKRRAGPLHHGCGNGLVRAGSDRAQYMRMPKGGRVAALLQLKAILIDAAGSIDREHELQVDAALRHRRRGTCQEDRAGRSESYANAPAQFPHRDTFIFRQQNRE